MYSGKWQATDQLVANASFVILINFAKYGFRKLQGICTSNSRPLVVLTLIVDIGLILFGRSGSQSVQEASSVSAQYV